MSAPSGVPQRCSVCGELGHKAYSHQPKRICSVDGCDKKHLCRGFCSAHYGRDKLYGDPLAGGTEKGALLKWLEEHVDYQGDDCLTWPFGTAKTGYPTIWFKGRTTKGHRAMCELRNGEAPSDDLEAAHSCGNGHLGCLNPNHLRWATRSENQNDRYYHQRIGAGRWLAQGEIRG